MSYKSLLIIIVFLLIPIVLLLRLQTHPKTVSAEWFNDSWTYRQAINISSHTTSETNVYITTSINIGSTTKSQADNGDFRFTNQSGQLLDYYLVSGVGTTQITVHLLLSSFPSGAQTLYAYYGNPSADNGFSPTDFSPEASNYTIGSLSTEETNPGPIAHWKFDEGVGTTAYDSSGHNINGTFGTGSSAPTWASEDQCVSGKCLKFDGTDDYLTFGAPNLNITNNVTTSFWFKPLNSGGVVMYQGWNYVGNEYGWVVHYGTNHHQDTNTKSISWGSSNNSGNYNGSAVSQTDASSISTSSWQHITITKDNTLVSIYINGQLSKTEDISVAPITYNGGYNLYVGKQHANDYYYPHFNGFLDEIKIYPYARTATQIKEDYNAFAVNIGSAPQESKANSDGLVAYWKMDEGIGTTTLDSSGNGYTATLTGSTAPSWTTGKYGNGIDFDYAGYAEFTDIAFGTTSPWTASFWIYPNNNKNNIPLGRGTQSSYIRAYVNGASSSIAVRNTAAETESGVTVTMNTGTWYMVTATADGTGQAKMYLNGQYVGMSNPGASGTPITFDRFGTAYPGNINFSIDAKMDEIRIYNRTLSNSEVFDLYNYAPGPMAYYKFDEGIGTTVYDSSGNSYNGTWFGSNTHWAAGKNGKAAMFSGVTTDYIRLSSLPKPSTMPITFSFWVKPNTTSISGVFDAAPGNSNVLRVYDPEGGIEWWASPSLSVSLPANNWSHITIIFDHDGTNRIIKWYKNGTLQATTSTSGLSTFAWVSTFTLGNINGSLTPFSGLLDDFKVYNYARTQKQIIEDMGSQNAPGGQTKLGSPIVHYKFDEGKGTTANNSGIGGTINGTFGTGSSAPTWTTSGKFSNALSFDGSNDYLQTNLPSGVIDTNTNSFTISAWVNLKENGYTSDIIVGKSGYHTGILPNQSGGYQCTIINNSNTAFNITTTNGLTNQWSHLTCVFDKETMLWKAYLNGKFVNQTTFTGTIRNYSTAFQVGGNTSGQMINAIVDDVKIYNYALTADEVKQDYNQGASLVAGSSNQTIGGTTTSLDYCIPGDTSTCSPPIAEWKMDEGIGTTAYDTSGNSNNARLVNSPSWSTGKTGKSIRFNGSNSYLSIGTSLSTNLDNVFTVEAWINPSISRRQMIYSNAYSGTSFNFGMSGNNLEIFYPGVYVASIGCSLPLNTWTHVTVVRSGTQNTKFYRNGNILTGGYDNNYTFSNAAAEKAIGRSSGGSTYFSGMIDQVRIYDYARTSAQIAYDYNRGGPVGWWKLDECQGSVAYDSSGVGNTGTITIGASGTQNTLGTCQVGTSAAWTNGASGKWNSSLNFDGTDDYIPTSTGALNNLSNLTVSFWAKGTGSPWGQGDGATSSFMEATRIFFRGSTASQSWYISNPFNANDWHHYLVTRTATSVALYKDGKLSQGPQSFSDSGTITPATTYNFLIGRTGTGSAGATSYFTGQIDDVRVYNYALTATQVKTLYSGGAVSFR